MSRVKSPICPLVYKDAIIYKALTMFHIERENKWLKLVEHQAVFIQHPKQ
jgi:hypothetical protein